jgi:hypothetical protein
MAYTITFTNEEFKLLLDAMYEYAYQASFGAASYEKIAALRDKLDRLADA